MSTGAAAEGECGWRPTRRACVAWHCRTSSASSPLLGIGLRHAEAAGLAPKTHALARLAALIAMDGSCVSYGWAVDEALTAGATADEIMAPSSRWRPSLGLPG